MIVALVIVLLVILAYALGTIRHRIDVQDAAEWDYKLDYPESDPEFWEAHEEIMDACYRGERS